MKNWILLFLIAAGCSHPTPNFEEDLAGESCDEALLHMPHKDPIQKVEVQVEKLAGHMARYTYVGVNYTTEILWNGTTGTIIYVGFCGPYVLALVAAASNATYIPSSALASNPSSSAELPLCNKKTLRAVHGTVKLPHLGKESRKTSAQWTCPDLKSVNGSIHKVAACYERRGDQESLQKAVTTMKNVEFSPEFFNCLEPSDQKAHMDYLEKLESELKESPVASRLF